MIDRATPDQVDKMLDQAERAAVREDAYHQGALYCVAFVLFGTILFLFGLCLLFLKYDAKDSMEKIVTLLVGLFSGGAGGFGLGRYTARGAD